MTKHIDTGEYIQAQDEISQADDLRRQLNHLIYLAGFGLTPQLDRGIDYYFRELERTLGGQTSDIDGRTEAREQEGAGTEILPTA